MTQTIILSCPPNTHESDAALSYCLKQARQYPNITCVFFVGHGIAHAFEQRNNRVSEWQKLCVEHHIPLYCCAHSIDQLTTPHTAGSLLTKPFKTTGLGILIEACVSSQIISFPLQNRSCTQNSSTSNTANIPSKNTPAARQKTEQSIVFNLHSHDIMCHVTMSALCNIALMLLVFEQKVTIHLQDNESKTDKEGGTQKINTSHWIAHNANTLANLKDMGIKSIILDEHLTAQLATSLQDLGLCVTSTGTSPNTPTHNDENKNIYI